MNHVFYKINLIIQLGRDGRAWLARCPAIDVATQGSTKKKVMEMIQEAVELWFESCIEAGILEKALKESGFREVDSAAPDSPNLIVKQVVKEVPVLTPRFTLTHDSWSNNYVEGLIPSAYLASCQLRDGSALAHV